MLYNEGKRPRITDVALYCFPELSAIGEGKYAAFQRLGAKHYSHGTKNGCWVMRSERVYTNAFHRPSTTSLRRLMLTSERISLWRFWKGAWPLMIKKLFPSHPMNKKKTNIRDGLFDPEVRRWHQTTKSFPEHQLQTQQYLLGSAVSDQSPYTHTHTRLIHLFWGDKYPSHITTMLLRRIWWSPCFFPTLLTSL